MVTIIMIPLAAQTYSIVSLPHFFATSVAITCRAGDCTGTICFILDTVCNDVEVGIEFALNHTVYLLIFIVYKIY